MASWTELILKSPLHDATLRTLMMTSLLLTHLTTMNRTTITGMTARLAAETLSTITIFITIIQTKLGLRQIHADDVASRFGEKFHKRDVSFHTSQIISVAQWVRRQSVERPKE